MGASLKLCGSTSVQTSKHSKRPLPSREFSDDRFQLRTLPISFHRKYELTQKLGKGAFANVYRVVDAEFPEEDLVAKVVDLALFDVKEEIEIMQKVCHIPYCARLVHYFLEGGFGYIVMERCDLNLYDFLCSRTNLDERSFVQPASDMFAALAAIHDLSIVHRDVKPENFLFSSNSGVLKLCDFGLSACLTRKNPSAKGVSGSSAFMSPEMLTYQRYGVKTDVWSLGVLMYAILLGEFPYMPGSPDRLAMMSMIAVGFPVPSFRPASSIESSSAVSIALLHKVLARDTSIRPMAKEALNHAWFKVSETSSHCTHTIMPAIISAGRVGAFSLLPNSSAPSEGMDPLLMVLQEASRASRALCPQREADINSGRFISVSSTSAGTPRTDVTGLDSLRASSLGSSRSICL